MNIQGLMRAARTNLPILVPPHILTNYHTPSIYHCQDYFQYMPYTPRHPFSPLTSHPSHRRAQIQRSSRTQSCSSICVATSSSLFSRGSNHPSPARHSGIKTIVHTVILAFGPTPRKVIHTIDWQPRTDGLGRLDKCRWRESDSVHESQGRNRRQNCILNYRAPGCLWYL